MRGLETQLVKKPAYNIVRRHMRGLENGLDQKAHATVVRRHMRGLEKYQSRRAVDDENYVAAKRWI